jgi:hypothetical protein
VSNRKRRTTVRVLALAGSLAAILGGCGNHSSTPADGAVTIEAQLSFFDIPDDRDRPIADVKLELWSYGPLATGGWAWAKDAIGSTDSNGTYSTTASFRGSDVTYAIRIIPSNGYAACCSGWSPVGFGLANYWIEPGQETGSPIHLKATSAGATVRFTHVFAGQWASIFNVLDTVRHEAIFVQQHERDGDSDRIGEVHIGRAGSGLTDRSWFDPVMYTLNLTPSARWNDPTILHEYGHYLEAQVSTLAWIVSSHSGCTPGRFAIFGGNGNIVTDYSTGNIVPADMRAKQAWLEGFADWLAEVVYWNDPGSFAPSVGPTPSLETANCAEAGPWPDGDRFENHVAAFLWDLTDPDSVAEPFDKDSGMGMVDEILTVFDNQLDGGGWPTIADFNGYLEGDPAFTSQSVEDIAITDKVSWLILN